MPQLEEIGIYLRGIWLLVQGKSEGFRWLDLTPRGVWRSFGAILWCLPAMAVSWASWRMMFLAEMPSGSEAGMAFIFKLFLVDVITWLMPLILIAALSGPLGFADALIAIIVSTNWLSIPVFYGMALPAVIRLVVPGSEGLSAMLSITLLVAMLIATYRVLKAVTGENQTLLASTLCVILVLPPLMVGNMLQRFFELLPP